MYGQGGSFNPHYRHGAPPPQQQAGVTGSFPQQPVPPPPAPYQQHPGLRPPPGPYQHGVLPPQNQPYPFAQHGQMHQMPMLPQQRGYAPMPMPGMLPPQQAMHQAPPQYPPLPPPPPRPSGFVHDNVLPPSAPPPSPPPPPPPLPPPPAAAQPPPHTPVVAQSWDVEAEAKEGASDGGCFAKTLEAATQLIVSDDSDMDMDGDEDSPSRQPLTPENSSLVTVECTGNVNVSKSISDVSSPGKDLPPGSGENAKTVHATEDGGSAFRLIQGYASDDSANEADAGPGGVSTLVILPEDNMQSHSSDRNTEVDYQKHVNAKGNVNTPHGTKQNGKAENYHLKDESNPVKHGTDVLGHLAKEDTSDSELEGGQSSKRHGRRQKNQTRSKSPQSRSGSPVGANKSSPSQSSSPVKQSKPPFAKRVHPAGDGNDSGGRVVQQEGLALTSKLDSSSNDLIGKMGDNAALDVALEQHCHSDNLISEHSQPVAASADTHKMQRPCPPSESQSDINVSSSAGDPTLMSQPAAGVPYMSVQTTKSSMASDHLQPHPQSLCPPEHMSSSNMIQLPGQPSFATSEFPQMQFQHKVIAPANEFLQNQMRSYPPQDVSHPRPFDFHHHTLPAVIPSNQQPSTIPVENAPVPHPDRWSEYSGGVGLSYSSHQPPYGQHQPPGNLDSGSNLVYPSFQRFPSNLPGSNNLSPLSDVDLTKSSIKPHYNPFASTFDKTDPSLDIGAPVSPNAIGSVSTTAEHMNTLSPFGRPRTHAHESSAEPVPNEQKLFRQEFASGAPYDPLLDSIEPSSSSINKVDFRKEKNWSAAHHRDASKLMNLEVDSEMHGLGVVAESEVEGLGEVAADTEAGVVENASPEFLGAKDWNSDIPGDVDNDQTLDKNKKGKDSRSMKLFKVAIADFVKEVLKPSWRQGNMSKEAFKTIVRKTVDKVSNSVPSSHVPKTPAKIKHYVQSSQKKVTKLVMGYVDKYVKP